LDRANSSHVSRLHLLLEIIPEQVHEPVSGFETIVGATSAQGGYSALISTIRAAMPLISHRASSLYIDINKECEFESNLQMHVIDETLRTVPRSDQRHIFTVLLELFKHNLFIGLERFVFRWGPEWRSDIDGRSFKTLTTLKEATMIYPHSPPLSLGTSSLGYNIYTLLGSSLERLSICGTVREDEFLRLLSRVVSLQTLRMQSSVFSNSRSTNLVPIRLPIRLSSLQVLVDAPPWHDLPIHLQAIHLISQKVDTPGLRKIYIETTENRYWTPNLERDYNELVSRVALLSSLGY
jgi:hypothetical protein